MDPAELVGLNTARMPTGLSLARAASCALIRADADRGQCLPHTCRGLRIEKAPTARTHLRTHTKARRHT